MEALNKEGIEVDEHEVKLERHIKEIGVYAIPIKLSEGIESSLKLWVVKE